MSDLFGHVATRQAPRVMMHAIDAGNFPDDRACAHYQCKRCGHDSGWIEAPATRSALLRGIPCPHCNGADHG